MKRLILCTLSMAFFHCTAVPSVMAQSIQRTVATPVKLQTVIGQKYAVKLQLVEIDREESTKVGLDVANNGNNTVNFSDKFMSVLKTLEEQDIAKVAELPTIIIRSRAPKTQSVNVGSGKAEVTVRSNVVEGDKSTSNVEVKFPASGRKIRFEFQSDLRQQVLATPMIRQWSDVGYHSYLLIASIDYASDNEKQAESPAP